MTDDWKAENDRDWKALAEAAEADIYKVTAANSVFGCSLSEVDDPKRQVGKVATLALGYMQPRLVPDSGETLTPIQQSVRDGTFGVRSATDEERAALSPAPDSGENTGGEND